MYLKNIMNNAADFYLYGAIVDNDYDTDGYIDPVKLRKELDDMQSNGGNVLNIYINSPGGSVFAASTMVSILKRFKDKGGTINAYVDGICASAATFIAMVANKVNIYSNSVVMIHKPLTIAVGNANDMRETITLLDKIEDGVMMPLYREKCFAADDELKAMIDAETWFSGNSDSDDYFGTFFDCELKETETPIAACLDKDVLTNYKNVPDGLAKEEAEPKKVQAVDYTEFEYTLTKLHRRTTE